MSSFCQGSFKENSRPGIENNNLGGIAALPKSLELNGGRHRHQSQFHAAVPLLPNTSKLYRWVFLVQGESEMVQNHLRLKVFLNWRGISHISSQTCH